MRQRLDYVVRITDSEKAWKLAKISIRASGTVVIYDYPAGYKRTVHPDGVTVTETPKGGHFIPFFVQRKNGRPSFQGLDRCDYLTIPPIGTLISSNIEEDIAWQNFLDKKLRSTESEIKVELNEIRQHPKYIEGKSYLMVGAYLMKTKLFSQHEVIFGDTPWDPIVKVKKIPLGIRKTKVGELDLICVVIAGLSFA